MQIFHKNKNNLVNLKEVPFKLERDIQRLVENNLTQATGLLLVKSEFSVQNQRIDTLAFDTENNAFVIIEYKRSHNYSVFDQGISYLNTLLKHKADFVLEYNEQLTKTLRKDKVDWSQSKVVFVAPAFNQTQKQAIDFKDLNIELWEIKQFENDIIVLNGLRKSIYQPTLKHNEKLSEITKEIKTYSEEEHLAGKSDDVIELYQSFKQAILNLNPEINYSAKKLYISFKLNRTLADIEIQKSGLKIGINMKKGELDDPKNLTKDVSQIGHWGNGDYQVSVKDTKNLEYIMSLIKQAL
ncbi:hypothetical protein GV127_10385 [Pasteurella multocida]|uniref:DUF5655 domain-containing protein n=1 Tax=Pasteurella multocida TaxID=747 RepID=UPI001396F8E1|nr:DUF5655 domain-containing protein [Pasteurella multocida]QHZ98584.1 hypothetical protein GV127_10385 [Pasteurella multocida]WNY76299.1 hypothetical protein H2513_10610 [Pasteurella multocida]WRK09377.1 DUF5655 domain-containing protein [Pasteurella multocida]HDR1924512.1 hypothetical protein [Pasteurella multocida]HDR1925882.1 hypothetical protein [Pasteurella multocida]